MGLVRRTIVITGGTSGIGRALAIALHEQGNKVIVTGRRLALLDELSNEYPGIAGYRVDVTQPDEVRHFAAELIRDHPAVDMLVNNAGIMKAEKLDAAAATTGDAEATVVTNLLGPIWMTNALLSHLLDREDPVIMNVSSGLAFVPLAITPTYCATKAAIHSYTVSLRRQLSPRGVTVLELIPPAVQTDLMPGHAENPHWMPLAQFIDEVMEILARQPVPAEICVERVKFMREAERDGKFEAVLDILNGA